MIVLQRWFRNQYLQQTLEAVAFEMQLHDSSEVIRMKALYPQHDSMLSLRDLIHDIISIIAYTYLHNTHILTYVLSTIMRARESIVDGRYPSAKVT